jgi:hypothetical protein
LEGLATENFGLFYDHLGLFYGHWKYFMAIWYILWYFGIISPFWTKKNLATLFGNRCFDYYFSDKYCNEGCIILYFKLFRKGCIIKKVLGGFSELDQVLQKNKLSPTSSSSLMDRRAGLPDFSWCKIPKRGEIYQMNTIYTKRPKHISNGRKIDQIVIKYTKIFHSKTLQKLPKLGSA